MTSRSSTRPRHLYVHVPFCRRKCHYCAFYSLEDRPESLMDRYVDALRTEASLCDAAGGWQTIYFGGGTPSLLGPARVGRILDAVGKPVRKAEVTLEANPDSLLEDELQAWRKVGINRLSIGVQSFSDDALKLLGRVHDSARALTAIHAARKAGFRVSIDLIYGLPRQRLQAWKEELRRVADLEIDHLSAYELTYEPGTVLGRKYGGNESDRTDLFFATHETLAELGIPGYEVSSFARTPDDRSRHNLATWAHKTYLGLGPAAHSFLTVDRQPTRRWNRASLPFWLDSLEQSELPPRESETLTPEQLLLERVMLGLRTTDGIDLERCRKELGIDLAARAGEKAGRLADQGLLLTQPDRWTPTTRGMALADRLALLLSSAT